MVVTHTITPGQRPQDPVGSVHSQNRSEKYPFLTHTILDKPMLSM